MNWIVIAAAALLAQPPSPEWDEIRRLEALVAAGAVAPARLAEARLNLSDAEDAAILARTLYAKIELQDFTEAQARDMVSAADRRAARQAQRLARQQKLIDAGVLPRADLEPLALELQSRRLAANLASGRHRLLRELAEMARSEEAAAATPSTALALGGGPWIEHFQGSGHFNDGDLKRITLEFEKEFSKPLPVSAKGDSAVHRALGFDHRGRVDVGLGPDTEEGRWMRKFLSRSRIPYIAFRRSIAGQATAPHIHLGTPSPRLAPAD